MPITPTAGAPKSFTQGDTVSFTESFADYSSAEWSLKFCMAASGVAISPVAGSENGDGFVVLISAAESAKIGPGSYIFSEVLTNKTDGTRLKVKSGTVIVLPDPTASISQTENMKILASLKAGMLKLSSGSQNEKVNFNGQEFTKRNIKDLQSVIDRYQVIVDSELRALGLSTKGGQKTIQSTFCA